MLTTSPPVSARAILDPAAAQLDAWIEREALRGWDPYDALNSPLLKRLTFGNRRLGQGWVQLLKRSPVNLRPLLGVPKGYNPKGLGLFLASYWRKYLLSGEPHDQNQARFCAEWLCANQAPGYHGACWGYNFDWPNRGFFAPAGTPTVVNTAFIGLAFVDLATLRAVPGAAAPGGAWAGSALQIARGACEFILRDLHRAQPEPDELCFSYTPVDQRYVHNANVLGASLLAEVAALTGERELAETALRAARYTARRQAPDGSWKYGEWEADGWIDNFHTGFVLVALQRLSRALATDAFADALARGYHYWKTRFFLPDLTPKYFHNQVYPIDTHSVAQAVLTCLAFADHDPEATDRAIALADWGVRHLQDPAGYFHYQIHPHYRIKGPYMRWSQAWMQRALIELAWTHAHPAGAPHAAVRSSHGKSHDHEDLG